MPCPIALRHKGVKKRGCVSRNTFYTFLVFTNRGIKWDGDEGMQSKGKERFLTMLENASGNSHISKELL